METMFHLLQDEKNPWWDDVTTPNTETRDDILTRAFIAGYDKGKDAQGDDWTKWRWGKMHTITLVESPLGQSGIGLIEDIFNRGPFPVSGSEAVVNKISWSTLDGFQASSGPALRAIYDLSDFNNSQLIFDGGQSGHPGDSHYDDFIQKWINFEYLPPLWNRADVEAGGGQHMTLQPEK
jgi:penicillin amidase